MRLALLVRGDPNARAYLFKAAAAQVVEEEARHAVVGHVDVGPPVLVVIPDGDAERLAGRGYPGAPADIRERAVAVVAVERAVRGLERRGNGVGPLPHLIVGDVVLQGAIGD